MNGVPDVGFKMKIRIHNEGVVEAVKKFSPPPYTPASGGHDGFNTNNGLMVIIDSLT